MKRTALAATAAAALLLLAGCTSTTTTETVAVTPGASGTYSDGGTTVEVEPLTAETPSATGSEETFLTTVRAELRPNNVIPNATDDQLIAAGKEACAKLAAAEDSSTISVIEGEAANGLGYYSDSGVIVSAARASLCD